MHTLNLGIVAHVDAGKTSLTERLLHAAGVIDEVGSVDDGTTQTDTLALERRRGITIKSAVASFAVGDVTVNLIDTPGHPDFVAEVERVLDVLDGAVLVVSAVEGVQAQTRLLARALQRLRVPTLIFVNKIDRAGADPVRVLRDVDRKLTPAAVAMGTVRGPGTREAAFVPYGPTDRRSAPYGPADGAPTASGRTGGAPTPYDPTGDAFATRLAETLAEHDQAVLAACLDGTPLPYDRLLGELAAQTGRAVAHPVFLGSAITGAGVRELTRAIVRLLPAAGADDGAPASGTVFKIDRGTAGEKIAYVRLFSGSVHVRDRLRLGRDGEDGEGEDGKDGQNGATGRGAGDGEAKVTAIHVFERGAAVPRATLTAGRIAKIWGLTGARIGDTVGAPRAAGRRRHFAPPTLETVVVPRRPEQGAALHAALARLAEQDPLINLRHDDIRRETSVSLYGEVQKEVIQETLAADFGLDAGFRETTAICVERPAGAGEAVEILGRAGNPFPATVGLRIEPAPPGTGVRFLTDVKVESVPLHIYKTTEDFRAAMRDTVLETLGQGLRGWRVVDCTVTVTHSGYTSPTSTARDFRLLTPLVLMSALKRAGTVVCEPVHRFHLEIPADTLGLVLPVLARLRAVPRTTVTDGPACLLEGGIPAARVHELQQRLPGLTRGEGVLECAFDRYEPVSGAAPSRPRTDRNPLNRKEYLLHLSGRA
ncbi:elongation factor G [Planobispora takensis]|uniref:Tetracycline resistance protein, tetM/tetO subfamily n=1 Tax=Planobispora takensis TaxID=1367882 RepID=A0A8J3T593_9ACTN|nr:TetM/TetW/TetO/TetS family tetracycline resistance ribosomal protection protein [Planobispora takensis]GII05421.1 tetracycline resistance protein, tetM/tetO subfamily [Planobispora takensis]